MNYLFWAQIIFWIFLFVYVFDLIMKNNKLKKAYEVLKSSIESQSSQEPK